MIGKQDRWQEDLFVACPLSELIPDDHVLKRVDKVLDLSWLRGEVRELYSETQGRPSIDPESAVRLMLAGFFQGIVHDRKLMREAQVNLAIRWFAGYRVHEKLPHHSSLTRIRQRWGAEHFKRIFHKTVQLCADAGLVDAETVHMDATLIRADVSWASLTEHHAERVLEENVLEEEQDAGQRVREGTGKSKKRSTTDPDATMTTSSSTYRMEPSFKQHTAVDDVAGVIVDVEVSTGEASEGEQLPQQLERVEATTGKKVAMVTADSAYAHSRNYALLEERDTEAVIPPQAERRKAKRIPWRRFKYDAKHRLVRCPMGKMLHRSSRGKNGWWYRAKAADCRRCPLQERCVSASARSRSVLIVDGYEALLRARRRRRRWDEATQDIYTRHRWRVEGVHAQAKTAHGLRRAVRRGLANVAIQVYLTAAVINLKRLAAFLLLFSPKYVVRARRLAVANPVWRAISVFYRNEVQIPQIAA
jgi:transposase